MQSAAGQRGAACDALQYPYPPAEAYQAMPAARMGSNDSVNSPAPAVAAARHTGSSAAAADGAAAAADAVAGSKPPRAGRAPLGGHGASFLAGLASQYAQAAACSPEPGSLGRGGRAGGRRTASAPLDAALATAAASAKRLEGGADSGGVILEQESEDGAPPGSEERALKGRGAAARRSASVGVACDRAGRSSRLTWQQRIYGE